jgi:putative ABC transport system permease protein
MATLWQDLKYALRRLGAQPRFAALAIATLALGIGATTIIFSVIQNVLLDPFPYLDADRVVSFFIHDQASARPGGRSFFQPPEFLAYQEESHVFEEVIGGGTEDALETTANGAEQFSAGYVTPNLFHFLGVTPLYGRGLTVEDARPGAPPVFVMAYKMWRRPTTWIRRCWAGPSCSTGCRPRWWGSCRRGSPSFPPICGGRWPSIASIPGSAIGISCSRRGSNRA